MKKPIIALTILGALFSTNIYLKYHNLSVPKPITTTQSQLGDSKSQQKYIDRANELKKLQNPTIIQEIK